MTVVGALKEDVELETKLLKVSGGFRLCSLAPTYLVLVLVLSSDNLTANLLKLAPDVNSGLNLLGILGRWVL